MSIPKLKHFLKVAIQLADATLVTESPPASLKETWDNKQIGFYQIFGECANLFEQVIAKEWLLVYWVIRTHGQIALEFKDFKEATRVFKRLTVLCRTYK